MQVNTLAPQTLLSNHKTQKSSIICGKLTKLTDQNVGGRYLQPILIITENIHMIHWVNQWYLISTPADICILNI